MRRAYTTFPAGPTALFIGLGLAGLAAAVAGSLRAEDATGRAIAIGVGLAMAIGAAGWGFARWRGRPDFELEGTAFWLAPAVKARVVDLGIVRTAFAATLDSTVQIWHRWQPNRLVAIMEAIAGARVRIGPAALGEHGEDGGLSYPGGEIALAWRPEDSLAHTCALLRHEIGHVILDALGYPAGMQHEMMRQAGGS